ncbi:MAG: PAS domain S-box protein [Rhodothermales bacterium]
MTFPLHALLVSSTPADPVLDALRRAGYDPHPEFVSTPKALAASLDRRAWDAVVVCHDEVGISAWEVLAGVQHRASCPPVVVVGDALGEAEAVALIGEGVRDVIRTADLGRLGVVVAKALRSHREQLAPRAEPEAESAFHALAAHMPIGLYRSTADGRILYANHALAQILGCDAVEDLLGEQVITTIKYPREAFVREIEVAGEVRDFVMHWERTDGEFVVTRENTRSVRDASGTLLYYEGTMEDITEERRAFHVEQRRARQLEAIVRFSAAVDAAQGSNALDAAILRVVEEALQADAVVFLRHSAEGFDVQTWSERIAEEVQACREQEVWKAYPVRTKPLLIRDERRLESPLLVGPMRDAMRQAGMRALGSFPLIHRGQPVGALVAFFEEPHTFSDGDLRMAETLAWNVAGAVTRWQAEGELRNSEASLRTIAAATGHVLYRLRFGATACDHISASVKTLTGYSARDLSEMGGFDTLIESREVIEGSALNGGDGASDSHYLALYRLRTADDQLRWVEDSASPWIDESGKVVGRVGVLQDVTERREREEAAHLQSRRSLAQQKALNELSTLDADAPSVLRRTTEVAAKVMGTGRVALWLLDEDSVEMRCHDLYELEEGRHRADVAFRADAVADAVEMLSHQRVLATADVMNKPLSERVGLDVYHARNGVRAVLTAPIRRGGRVVGFVAFEHLAAPRTWTLDEQDFAGAVGDLLALTLEREQRAHAEAALRESELRYRAISELAADYAHALTVEPDGSHRLAWVTDAFERISGYTIDEVEDLDGLQRIVHEDDRPALAAEIELLRQGRTIDLEMRIRTKSGEERWIWHRSRPVRDERGRMSYIYSTGQDITERKRFETALVAAREEAEEMARQKSEFLASMSHEIRTPLTGLLGFAGVLAEELDGEQREFARLIEQSGRRLLGTVNSVLDLAKLESEGIELVPEPLDIVDEARQVVLLLSPLADGKGIALRLRTDERELIAPLDAVCLHRILNNLVGNAIKFTESGHVTIEVATEGDRVRLDVVDSGVGIDEDFLPHLFDEFRQEDQGNSHGHGGSGLGLAITKKLVGIMGGTVNVESVKGEGSRFTLTFPSIIEPERVQEAIGRAFARNEDAMKHAARAIAEPEAGDFDLTTLVFTHPSEADPGSETAPVGTTTAGPSWEPVETVAKAPSATDGFMMEDDFMLTDLLPSSATERSGSDGDAVEGFLSLSEVSLRVTGETKGERLGSFILDDVVPVKPVAPPAEGRPRVLLIEDDPQTRTALERVLQSRFAVDVATEARTALDRMAKGTYDAFVLDVNLGGSRRGVNVLRVARTLPGYAGTVAVALLPNGVGDVPFLDAGFDHCVSRPFTKERLEKLLAVLDRAGKGAA